MLFRHTSRSSVYTFERQEWYTSFGGRIMELRVLRYFLAVAREQSVSGAAESMHVSQPSLSRQLMNMEDELGKKLFIRGGRKITLTEDGMILRRHAQEIMELVEKAKNEISVSDETIAGDVYIGSGETDKVRLIARAAQKVRAECPLVRFHISSGDGTDMKEDLARGLIDFALIMGPEDLSKYEVLPVQAADTWGILMKKDDPLALKPNVTIDDFRGRPLIISRQMMKTNVLPNLFKVEPGSLNIAATYSLLFNASLMVDEGFGYALCLDKIINTTGDSTLCFKPFEHVPELGMNIVWKKYQLLNRACAKFLEKLRETVGEHSV